MAELSPLTQNNMQQLVIYFLHFILITSSEAFVLKGIVMGVYEAGFTTTVFPEAIAGIALHQTIISG